VEPKKDNPALTTEIEEIETEVVDETEITLAQKDPISHGSDDKELHISDVKEPAPISVDRSFWINLICIYDHLQVYKTPLGTSEEVKVSNGKRELLEFVKKHDRLIPIPDSFTKKVLKPILEPIFKTLTVEDMEGLTQSERGRLYFIGQDLGLKHPDKWMFQERGQFDPHRAKERITQAKDFVTRLEQDQDITQVLGADDINIDEYIAPTDKVAFDRQTRDRQALLEKMVKHAADTLGIQPPPIVKYDPNDKGTASTNYKIPSKITFGAAAFKHGGRSLIGTVFHEAVHALQNNIEWRFDAKELKTGERKFGARVMSSYVKWAKSLGKSKRPRRTKPDEPRDVYYASLNQLGDSIKKTKNLSRYEWRQGIENEREAYSAGYTAEVAAARSSVFNKDPESHGIMRKIDPDKSAGDMRTTIGRQIEKDIDIPLSDLAAYAQGDTPLPAEKARQKLWNLETLKTGTDTSSSLINALECQVPDFYKILEDKTHPSHPLISLLDTIIVEAIDGRAHKITPAVQTFFQEKYKDDNFQFPIDAADLETQKRRYRK